MDKELILEKLKKLVATKLEESSKRQKEIQEATFHEENKSEGDKDTRAIESSYLARGLAKQVQQLMQQQKILEQITIPTNAAKHQRVQIMSLLTLEDENSHTKNYLITPVAGGYKIKVASKIIRTITPNAPLAKLLINKRSDDEIIFHLGNTSQTLYISDIS